MGKKLTVLLAVVLFLAVGGEAMGLIEEFIFSNKKYSENIAMETYLISEEKLAEVLSNRWEQKITQETHRELYRKTVYLVIRVKNKGRYSAWGFLACRVNGGNVRVYIDGVPFKGWFSYIIPMGEFTSKNDDAVPTIETKWEKLYTK